MNGHSLRSRILLTFCLTGIGSVAVLLASLWLGFRQLGDPEALSAFVTVGVAATFGLLGLVALVWLTFDERFAKPVERLAAHLRIRADRPVDTAPDPEGARHLGDLATAAHAVCLRLKDSAGSTAVRVAQETERLRQQTAQLLRILSDIPIAVIVATNDHQIVLYDGQAADLMEREAPARLNASIFEYLDRETLIDAVAQMRAEGAKRREIAISGLSGTLYSGHVRVFGDDQGYTLMLAPLDPDAERPLTFDFGLFDRNCAGHLDDTDLRDLVFVVFDCETTGLDPVKDEVVQLGAVRIVNGRIVPGERIDALVKPPIPIPAASTRVHGIDEAAVANAPPFAEVCRILHRFAQGAVLVAHNAPFDMAFVRRCNDSRVRFDNAVLDTVHLSAMVFGGSAEHTLDAICARLSVTIPQECRHTAAGDAEATAQALVAMLPILQARGLRTFGQVKAEARKHARILQVQG